MNEVVEYRFEGLGTGTKVLENFYSCLPVFAAARQANPRRSRA
jgi:hypothetical protein